ncbi:unnamed protein product [Cyprideis torosa]|uniref:Uncharacterized protein n=1 Tax=Cyprideis torosa TaxID=163714 RepID=A0A7R8ZWU8_9CRUS|nr:unnamed protein product [Cyprideis torosa]CAG0905566.1 unnamed protein product [Cyprideis torosa]
MAASNVPRDNRMGIETEWLIDPVPESLKCPICLHPPLDAVLLSPCGHTVCESCARRWLLKERKRTCPSCKARTSYDSRLPNHTVRGVVGELRVRCPEEGCDEQLQLQNLDVHRRQCVTKTTTCPGGCGRKLLNKEKVTHNCVEYLTEENKQLRDQMRKKDEELARLRQRFQDLPTTSLGRAPSSAPLAARTSGEAAFRFQGLPKMEFRLKESDWNGEEENGEVQSNVVEAGGLRWSVTLWISDMPRLLVQAESGEGAPSPWTLTVQSLTVKVQRKGREGGAPATHRLDGATFSSEKEVVGMLSGWSWRGLTNPSNGFVDSQGTLHLEVSFEGAAMSPSPPPQRPTVWEAEATLQLREFTSSLREWGDSIFSPSVHVGGEEWRVRVSRWGGYSFYLQCNPEERNAWSLRADWSISLLSAGGGGGNEEMKGDGEEVRRGRPLISGLYIPDYFIARFLTGDTARVRVNIRVHH